MGGIPDARMVLRAILDAMVVEENRKNGLENELAGGGVHGMKVAVTLGPNTGKESGFNPTSHDTTLPFSVVHWFDSCNRQTISPSIQPPCSILRKIVIYRSHSILNNDQKDSTIYDVVYGYTSSNYLTTQRILKKITLNFLLLPSSSLNED